jgi:hypothetical protein
MIFAFYSQCELRYCAILEEFASQTMKVQF